MVHTQLPDQEDLSCQLTEGGGMSQVTSVLCNLSPPPPFIFTDRMDLFHVGAWWVFCTNIPFPCPAGLRICYLKIEAELAESGGKFKI